MRTLRGLDKLNNGHADTPAKALRRAQPLLQAQTAQELGVVVSLGNLARHAPFTEEVQQFSAAPLLNRPLPPGAVVFEAAQLEAFRNELYTDVVQERDDDLEASGRDVDGMINDFMHAVNSRNGRAVSSSGRKVGSARVAVPRPDADEFHQTPRVPCPDATPEELSVPARRSLRPAWVAEELAHVPLPARWHYTAPSLQQQPRQQPQLQQPAVDAEDDAKMSRVCHEPEAIDSSSTAQRRNNHSTFCVLSCLPW